MWCQVGVIDVRRAFLHGSVEREVYVEIPVEDPRAPGGRNIGRFKRGLYGTRDAPLLWQKLVKQTMTGLGFGRSLSAPGIYFHPQRDLRIISHVDDLLIGGCSLPVGHAEEEEERKISLSLSLASQPQRGACMRADEHTASPSAGGGPRLPRLHVPTAGP